MQVENFQTESVNPEDEATLIADYFGENKEYILGKKYFAQPKLENANPSFLHKLFNRYN